MAKALEDQFFPQLEERPAAAKDYIRFEPTQRRVRVMFAGVAIADSRKVMLMLENRRLAVYYFPVTDVRTDLFVPTTYSSNHPGKGDASFFSVKVGERVAEKAAWRYLQPDRGDLKDYVAFYWDKMDGWFEEEDEVFVHPRDPYHRVDVLNSSRHVKVVVGGVVVAETDSPRLLFETGLPTRYYIPKLDVRLELLTPTDTVTRCPYKGQARYWSAEGVTDAAWSYTYPLPAVTAIAGHIAFFQERVDETWVDGEQVER